MAQHMKRVSMFSDPAALIIVFTKVPVVDGEVKTRLVASLGRNAALEIAKHLLFATLDNALSTGAPVRCSFTGSYSALHELIGDRKVELTPHAPRVESDDARISSVVNTAFEEGFRRVLVLPSDAPTVEVELQVQALQLLCDWDVVVSPSPDGGFACLGVASRLPLAFDALRLTTANLYFQVSELLLHENLRVHSLPSRVDIDDMESIRIALSGGQVDHNPVLRRLLAEAWKRYAGEDPC